ncbi:histidine phosphatase family protein [Frigidibacter mobilis]|uniref:Phosphoglycerate/bisphosphoglycerate mutase n=1 Tax=Frigidibacter mobilis TaxID=1335048 RepID=A0A159Z2L7_9RHOB|nr:histidine phosphatase family protein [Frigidibacter mobilis]AMY69317.1 phosphoglycerate/bisphosphoglycerate mutase [Frigidibacter mobilis]
MIPLFSQSFLFLRHGETAHNRAGIIAGATDVPLNAAGLAQAEMAAELLAEAGIAAIWCSPLIRARVTAETVAARLGLPLRVLPGLAERNWGAWEGQPYGVLVREMVPPGGGEGPGAFQTRVTAALAQVTSPFPALIVGHSGTARVLGALLCPGVVLPRFANAVPVLWQREEDVGHAPDWSLRVLGASDLADPLVAAARAQP